MCVFLLLLFFGPRAATVIWWLLSPARFTAVFNSWLVTIIGIVFVPWTTLMYTIVGLNGVSGWDWLWLGLAFLGDLASYASSAYSQKDKLEKYDKPVAEVATETAPGTTSGTESSK